MQFNDDLVDALRERQADNVTPDGKQLMATWTGNAYPVCAGEAFAGRNLGVGGMGLESDLILVMVTADLVPNFQTAADLAGKIPVAKQTLVYQGKTYRIVDTHIPPGLAFIVLGLMDPTKGA